MAAWFDFCSLIGQTRFIEIPVNRISSWISNGYESVKIKKVFEWIYLNGLVIMDTKTLFVDTILAAWFSSSTSSYVS